MIVEFIAGLVSGSLALMADAGHMLSDVAALGLSLFAMRISSRPPTRRRTYGFQRVEVLAALMNGATLIAIAILIAIEAVQRFSNPPEVQGKLMMLVAVGGLCLNLISLGMLHRSRNESLNLRGAFLHILTDALGSIGAILAGVAVWAFSWNWADPLISLLIAALVAWSSWDLVKQAVAVLMEEAPGAVNVEDLEIALVRQADVLAVHDLHVWSITTDMTAMSAHMVVGEALTAGERDRLLAEVRDVVKMEFGIAHATIQIETNGLDEHYCGKESADGRCHS